MWSLRKRKRETLPVLPHRDIGAAIEIIAHNEAAQETAQKAREANRYLHELLEQNGFTLKIYLAAKDHSPEPKSDKP